MKREVAQNERYATARKWALVIAYVWVGFIVFDRVLAIAFTILGAGAGFGEAPATVIGPMLVFSLFIPIAILMTLYTQNNVVFLNVYLFISGVGTIGAGLASGDFLISPALGLLFVSLGTVLLVLPIMKDYRKRTKEIMNAHNPRKQQTGAYYAPQPMQMGGEDEPIATEPVDAAPMQEESVAQEPAAEAQAASQGAHLAADDESAAPPVQ
jgi:hypothetical protein